MDPQYYATAAFADALIVSFNGTYYEDFNGTFYELYKDANGTFQLVPDQPGLTEALSPDGETVMLGPWGLQHHAQLILLGRCDRCHALPSRKGTSLSVGWMGLRCMLAAQQFRQPTCPCRQFQVAPSAG